MKTRGTAVKRATASGLYIEETLSTPESQLRKLETICGIPTVGQQLPPEDEANLQRISQECRDAIAKAFYGENPENLE